MPNWICLGVVPGAKSVIRPELPTIVVAFVLITMLLLPVGLGTFQFWILNTLNASARSCKLIPSRIGKLLNNDKSVLKTDFPRKTLRPKFPNAPCGIPNAQGLNQLTIVCVSSAAFPPCEIVLWHKGSGFAATGPGINGSCKRLGRKYVLGVCVLLPFRFAKSPVTVRLYSFNGQLASVKRTEAIGPIEPRNLAK
jgi:hypothetical protein